MHTVWFRSSRLQIVSKSSRLARASPIKLLNETIDGVVKVLIILNLMRKLFHSQFFLISLKLAQMYCNDNSSELIRLLLWLKRDGIKTHLLSC